MLKLFKLLKKKHLIYIGVTLILQIFCTLYLPTLTADIINNGIIKGDVPYVLKTGGIMLAVAVATGLFAIISTYIATMAASGLGRDIRNKLFSHTQKLSINDFKKFTTGSMITRATSDTNQVQQAFLLSIQMLAPAPIIAIVGMILTYQKSPSMALILGVTIFIFLLISLLVSKKTIPIFNTLQEKMDKINSKLRETIIGVRVIRAFNKTEYEQKRLKETFEDYAHRSIQVSKIFAILMPSIMLIMNLSTVVIFWFGSLNVVSGAMQIGDIMAIIEYSIIILFYLIMGAMTLMLIPRAQACSKRINEVLEQKPEILDPEVNEMEIKTISKMEFRNVTFCYEDAEEPVLNNLNFTAISGETTAIIGGTGSGKTTIAKLIPRLHDIQGGNILIDGIDIKEMKQELLRDKIAFVPQKSFLFSGTIVENIKQGKKDATIEEIEHAVQIAQATDFIKATKNGYNSLVAQGGNNFSGGQKQRLCLARAIVKKAPIYVFDDSFSALDFKTDSQLREALKPETKEAIVIVVAQRISSIMHANKIIVLKEGNIVGMGTHKELLGNCEEYSNIAKSQLSEEEL